MPARFPSPVKGWLQEQLKDPTVFVHEAELWQSCRPLTHSSISISVKEKNKVLRLVLVVFCLFFCLFRFVSFRFCFVPFPQVRYYPYNKKVEQMTLYKVRKVVRVLSDFAVARRPYMSEASIYQTLLYIRHSYMSDASICQMPLYVRRSYMPDAPICQTPVYVRRPYM